MRRGCPFRSAARAKRVTGKAGHGQSGSRAKRVTGKADNDLGTNIMSVDIATPTPGHYISQRLKLRYLDWGNADKPDLIFMHGGQDHVYAWHWIAPEFAKDWHVMA